MVTLVIQAGGESRRMGRNKALVSFLGRPLVQHVIERLRPLADEVLITTNQPAGLESLSVPLVADVFPGQGALGGLYTAVWAAKYPVVAVVACDMPFASLDLLQFQIDVLVQQNQDVVIPGSEEGWEPLHCVYRKPTCLPQIKAALVQGQKRLISWFPNVNVRYLQGNEVRRYDPLGIAFRNINTPEELQQAEVLARKLA
ncbi:molybdenum cofactor guanylyltransferase [Longilinea arvoryzae]|nr:molybdenum cofactor guanylyltransferase [Longilinea arvoryzae]